MGFESLEQLNQIAPQNNADQLVFESKLIRDQSYCYEFRPASFSYEGETFNTIRGSIPGGNEEYPIFEFEVLTPPRNGINEIKYTIRHEQLPANGFAKFQAMVYTTNTRKDSFYEYGISSQMIPNGQEATLIIQQFRHRLDPTVKEKYRDLLLQQLRAETSDSSWASNAHIADPRYQAIRHNQLEELRILLLIQESALNNSDIRLDNLKTNKKEDVIFL